MWRVTVVESTVYLVPAADATSAEDLVFNDLRERGDDTYTTGEGEISSVMVEPWGYHPE